MATAIWVKSESSDNYLWAVEGTLTAEEVKELLKSDLEDEYNYIADIEVAYSNGDTLEVDVWE